MIFRSFFAINLAWDLIETSESKIIFFLFVSEHKRCLHAKNWVLVFFGLFDFSFYFSHTLLMGDFSFYFSHTLLMGGISAQMEWDSPHV